MITTQDISQADVTFTQFRVVGDSAIFLGSSASDLQHDQLTVRSLAPKAGNGFHGNRRTALSLVRTTDVTSLTGDPVKRDRKSSVEFSMPVGSTVTELTEDAYQLGTLLRNAAFIEQCALKGIIEH